ncbi:MAG TPA: hypothetical protein PK006_05770 [Saprospiraceae bacterium]|nr:hypothetical protein [Saprospiraceae bacterium]
MNQLSPRLMIALIFCAASFSLLAQSDFKIGQKLFKEAQYEQAAPYFAKHVESNPGDYETAAKLALCYKNSAKDEQALNVYAKLCKNEGLDPEIYFSYADLLKTKTQFEEARTFFAKYSVKNEAIARYFMQSCDYAIAELSKPSNCDLAQVDNDAPLSLNGNEISLKSPNSKQVIAASLIANPNSVPSNFSQVLSMEALGQGNATFDESNKTVIYSKMSQSNLKTVLNQKSGLHIFISKIQSNGTWAEGEAFPYLDSKYSHGFPFLTQDGQTLYFSSNQPGGYGGFDIYKSEKDNTGQWSAPENLGSLVNTPGNEVSPSYTNSSLYFSSDWHKGFGGLDVFRINRRGEIWSNVENIGNCVNSAKDEYYFSIDREGNSYFNSNRENKTNTEGIYKTTRIKISNFSSEAPIETKGISEKSILVNNKAQKLDLYSEYKNEIYDDPAVVEKPNGQQEKVYFIQITALSNFNETMYSRFNKFASYGNIYRVESDGVSKIRIGIFQTLNEALEQLRIVKKNGVKDAFIIGDIMDNNRVQLIISANTSAQSKVTEIQDTEDPNSVIYKVRVAEFKAPDWFDSAKISDLGKIEHWTKSGWTIIMLGNFKTPAEAKVAVSQLKSRGFNEAYICTEQDGKIYKYNEN